MCDIMSILQPLTCFLCQATPGQVPVGGGAFLLPPHFSPASVLRRSTPFTSSFLAPPAVRVRLRWAEVVAHLRLALILAYSFLEVGAKLKLSPCQDIASSLPELPWNQYYVVDVVIQVKSMEETSNMPSHLEGLPHHHLVPPPHREQQTATPPLPPVLQTLG